MNEHDDLEAWRDDPLVRALRAPGTEAELAGEKEMVAAFRAAAPRGTLRRVIGRLGVGGTAIVTTVALSSGVAAAAYTRVLPDPVQEIAHEVLGPIGVPDAPPHKPRREVRRAVVPPVRTPSASPSAEAHATPRPRRASRAGRPRSTRSSQRRRRTRPRPRRSPTAQPTDAATPPAEPTTDPTPSPSAEPTPSPTPDPTPARRPARSVSIGASSTRIGVGSNVTLSGVVRAKHGKRLRNREVHLLARPSGQLDWTEVAAGITGPRGGVALTATDLGITTTFRLRVGETVRSLPVRVAIVPIVDLSFDEGATLRILTVGGRGGDTVVLLRRQHGRLVPIDRVLLDDAGAAVVPVQQRAKGYRLVVRLKGTRAHTQAQARIAVPPRAD